MPAALNSVNIPEEKIPEKPLPDAKKPIVSPGKVLRNPIIVQNPVVPDIPINIEASNEK